MTKLISPATVLRPRLRTTLAQIADLLAAPVTPEVQGRPRYLSGQQALRSEASHIIPKAAVSMLTTGKSADWERGCDNAARFNGFSGNGVFPKLRVRV